MPLSLAKFGPDTVAARAQKCSLPCICAALRRALAYEMR